MIFRRRSFGPIPSFCRGTFVNELFWRDIFCHSREVAWLFIVELWSHALFVLELLSKSYFAVELFCHGNEVARLFGAELWSRVLFVAELLLTSYFLSSSFLPEQWGDITFRCETLFPCSFCRGIFVNELFCLGTFCHGSEVAWIFIMKLVPNTLFVVELLCSQIVLYFKIISGTKGQKIQNKNTWRQNVP